MIKQGSALEKLFNAGLFLNIRGERLEIIIDFCVEKWSSRMIEVNVKMRHAILQTFEKSTHPSVLDLSFIRNNNQLSDLTLNLSHGKVLAQFLRELDKLAICNRQIRSIDKLIMSNNEIKSLKPFEAIEEFSLLELDLQFNLIEDIHEFHHIKRLRINKLYLIGNSITKTSNIESILMSVLPSIRWTDGSETHVLCLPKTPNDIVADNRDVKIGLFKEDTMNIDSTNLDSDFKKNFRNHFKKDMWQRVFVQHNGKLKQNELLEELIKTTNPFPFYPCYYRHGDKVSSFFVIGHFDALNVLIQNNLKLKMSTSDDELILHIKLNCAEFRSGQIDWSKKINYVIKKRMQSDALNLERFVNDEDFGKLFTTFSSRHLVAYVMTVANMLNENITSLVLRGNQIASIDESLALDFASIDLRDNQINSLSVFPPTRRTINIQEIFLDRNPLCLEYSNNPSKYLKDVLQVFPSLKALDGLQIDRDISDNILYQNFLVSPKLQPFVEYFIKFYFDLYDSEDSRDKMVLSHSYDTKAIFTHRSESCKSYFCGRESIKNYFESLPLTQHNFSKINIDVPHKTSHQIFIVINGLFEEKNTSQVFMFTRTFVIERTSESFGVEAHKFVITNDLFRSQKTNEKLENSLIENEKER